jgi:hypothetical protein
MRGVSEMPYCEDFPCCGHTSEDPCGRQPYDEPGYYDTSVPGQEHRLCDHENGECNVEEYDDEEDTEDNLSDVDADSMTLASAGMGTDEDYGYFGSDY